MVTSKRIELQTSGWAQMKALENFFPTVITHKTLTFRLRKIVCINIYTLNALLLKSDHESKLEYRDYRVRAEIEFEFRLPQSLK